jgi:hypothetical protein
MNKQQMNKQVDLVSLPITDKMATVLEILTIADKSQVGVFIEDLIRTSARRAQMDMDITEMRNKLKQLAFDVYQLSLQQADPAALAILLRETMEEYGDMIISNHIPIQDITFIYHDTLTINFQNREE